MEAIRGGESHPQNPPRVASAIAVGMALILALSGCIRSAQDNATDALRSDVEKTRDYVHSLMPPELSEGSLQRTLDIGFRTCAIEELAEREVAPPPDLISTCQHWLYSVDEDEFRAHFLFVNQAQAQTLSGGFYSDSVHSCVRMTADSGNEIRVEHEPCPAWVSTGWPYELGKEVGL